MPENVRRECLYVIDAGLPNKLWHTDDRSGILMLDHGSFRHAKMVEKLCQKGDSQKCLEIIPLRFSLPRLSMPW